MLRLLVGIYLLGIIVVFVLFLVMRPATPIGSAVVNALIWPYGVYLLIDEKVDVDVKTSGQVTDPHLSPKNDI